MTTRSLNLPRFADARAGGFYEAYFIVASDARAGIGLWLRYAVDVSVSGEVVPSVWGTFFDRNDRSRNVCLQNRAPAAAIRRNESTVLGIGPAELGLSGCSGEVEGEGRSLLWRLQFGEEDPNAFEVTPSFLKPVALLKRSGYAFPRPQLKASGAIEVDGQPLELRAAPGLQAHLWGARRYPAWAWAHCSGFDEAPGSALDLLSVQGPGGVFVPLFSLRYQGELHQFANLPWIALSRSRRASPAWHFSAEDATLAVDGVIRAELDDMVEVEYQDPDGKLLYCSNTELAHAELRVRRRSFPGAPWRPEGTLLCNGGAGLEFCGPERDSRVRKKLVSSSRPDGPNTGASPAA